MNLLLRNLARTSQLLCCCFKRHNIRAIYIKLILWALAMYLIYCWIYLRGQNGGGTSSISIFSSDDDDYSYLQETDNMSLPSPFAFCREHIPPFDVRIGNYTTLYKLGSLDLHRGDYLKLIVNITQGMYDITNDYSTRFSYYKQFIDEYFTVQSPGSGNANVIDSAKYTELKNKLLDKFSPNYFGGVDGAFEAEAVPLLELLSLPFRREGASHSPNLNRSHNNNNNNINNVHHMCQSIGAYYRNLGRHALSASGKEPKSHRRRTPLRHLTLDAKYAHIYSFLHDEKGRQWGCFPYFHLSSLREEAVNNVDQINGETQSTSQSSLVGSATPRQCKLKQSHMRSRLLRRPNDAFEEHVKGLMYKRSHCVHDDVSEYGEYHRKEVSAREKQGSEQWSDVFGGESAIASDRLTEETPSFEKVYTTSFSLLPLAAFQVGRLAWRDARFIKPVSSFLYKELHNSSQFGGTSGSHSQALVNLSSGISRVSDYLLALRRYVGDVVKVRHTQRNTSNSQTNQTAPTNDFDFAHEGKMSDGNKDCNDDIPMFLPQPSIPLMMKEKSFLLSSNPINPNFLPEEMPMEIFDEIFERVLYPPSPASFEIGGSRGKLSRGTSALAGNSERSNPSQPVSNVAASEIPENNFFLDSIEAAVKVHCDLREASTAHIPISQASEAPSNEMRVKNEQYINHMRHAVVMLNMVNDALSRVFSLPLDLANIDAYPNYSYVTENQSLEKKILQVPSIKSSMMNGLTRLKVEYIMGARVLDVVQSSLKRNIAAERSRNTDELVAFKNLINNITAEEEQNTTIVNVCRRGDNIGFAIEDSLFQLNFNEFRGLPTVIDYQNMLKKMVRMNYQSRIDDFMNDQRRKLQGSIISLVSTSSKNDTNASFLQSIIVNSLTKPDRQKLSNLRKLHHHRALVATEVSYNTNAVYKDINFRILTPDAPRSFILDNILTNQQCSEFIYFAWTELDARARNPSSSIASIKKTHDGNNGSKVSSVMRYGPVVLVTKHVLSGVANLEEKVALFIGVPLSHVASSYIVRFRTGEENNVLDEVNRPDSDRIATALTWLSSAVGGDILFPKSPHAVRSIRSSKGSTLVWYNLNLKGKYDINSFQEHAELSHGSVNWVIITSVMKHPIVRQGIN